MFKNLSNRKIFNNLFHAAPDFSLSCKILTIMLSIVVTIGTFYFTYTNVLNGDEREHVSASFFIFKGLIPYRDFFEHHHPLLWYIFQPVLLLFNNSPYIWYAARTFALGLIIIDCFIIWKICHLISKSSYLAWLSILFSLSPHCVFLSQTEFRPDDLMMTFYLSGLYNYFKALQKNDFQKLHLAFTFFCLSFFALQKACFQLTPIILLTLYLIYKKDIPFTKALKALLIPCCLIVTYLAYLYQTNALKDYFELNWLLNMKINLGFQYPVHLTTYYYLANVLAFCSLLSKEKILKYIASLCLGTSFILQFIFLGAFRHYWLPIYPYFAIISAYYIIHLASKIKTLALVAILLVTINNYIKHRNIILPYGRLSSFVYLSKQVLSLTSPDDLIIGCTSTVGGLRLDATGYYWFGRDYMAILDNHYFHRREFPIADFVLKAKKPKLLSAEDWRICITPDYKFTFACKSVPTYDKDFLQQYYIHQGYIYTRKN